MMDRQMDGWVDGSFPTKDYRLLTSSFANLNEIFQKVHEDDFYPVEFAIICFSKLMQTEKPARLI